MTGICSCLWSPHAAIFRLPHSGINQADFALPLQQRIYAERSYQGKDTAFDLAKMLRWRWREVGGLEKLTGSPNFILRPVWAGFTSHEHSRMSRNDRETRQDDAPRWRTQRHAHRNTRAPTQQPESKQSQAGSVTPLQQPALTQKTEAVPLDW